MEDAQPQIDQLIAGFFESFDNRAGRVPDFDRFRAHFVAGAAIGNLGPEGVRIWSLQEFWEPRCRLLTEGTLTDFHEWETSAETTIVHGLATRRSSYEKAGLLNGTVYAGTGTKCFQLASTGTGWRIAFLLWEDR